MSWSTAETLALIDSQHPQLLVTAPAFGPVKANAHLLSDIMASY